eukprot:CAMPEP_0204544314 /NCGR_PEP_ID=MMETSP0661-20131031/20456_1 /ASSEMBLY_ACC=CAM_ASM_000606 /TAXON_ID=109239 /ORGANISM="Alexandrium margalefi, Strain AMGDE01CS-322" /LENGTH=94 /DNA_ID=CAMNT_0051551085 /DNA_START=37 /DNA_END=317 /DNA_ORIENTATION=+
MDPSATKLETQEKPSYADMKSFMTLSPSVGSPSTAQASPLASVASPLAAQASPPAAQASPISAHAALGAEASAMIVLASQRYPELTFQTVLKGT